MVIRANEIVDADTLEQWLREWPASQEMSEAEARQVAVQIAHRAGMRVLPIAWELFSGSGARKGNWTAISVFRCLLLTEIASNCPPDLIQNFSALAIAAKATLPIADKHDPGTIILDLPAHAHNFDPISEYYEFENVNRIFYNSAAIISRSHASISAGIAVSRVFGLISEYLVVLRGDAKAFEEGERPKWNALWGERTPEEFVKAEQNFRSNIEEDGAVWDFWLRFYEMGKQGETPPLEMLLKIAEIPDEDWEAGPTRIAELIAGIELEWLRSEVTFLKSELAETRQTHSSAIQRGHNGPPELVEDDVQVAASITIVWDVLDAAEAELEQDAPDPPKLKLLAEKLWAALKVILAYCGKITDKGVSAFAVATGSAGGAVVVDAIANNGRLLQFAKHLLQFTGGG